MADRSAAIELLGSVKLAKLTEPQQQVYSLEHQESIGAAIRFLAKHRVLSAPLVVSPGLEELSEPGDDGATRVPSLLGWIDVVDLLKGLLAHLKEKQRKLPTSMLALMPILETEGKTYSQKQLVTLHGTEDRGLIYQGDADATLLDTIRTSFLNSAEGVHGRVVHRLALFDSDGGITHVVSQLDVIRFLAQHTDKLGPLAGRTVAELGLLDGHPPITAVDPHIPTILAYERMLAHHFSAAPVVNDKGEMVANLSVSDLRCIQPEHLGVLALPVAEFLALLHRTSYLGYSQRSSKSADHPFFAGSPKPHGRPVIEPEVEDSADTGDIKLIAATKSSTFAEVLRLMSENHVHRVYILDPAATPQVVGVVSPTDILCWLVDSPRPMPTSRASSLMGSPSANLASLGSLGMSPPTSGTLLTRMSPPVSGSHAQNGGKS